MSTKQDNGGHWYTKTGEPMHWVKRASGEGTRPTTLADARKLDLLPSVTTILRTLDKPALTRWMILEAVKAVVTDPDRPGEGLDAKVERVLSEERQQEQEAAQAADLGTRIHEAIEWNMSKGPYRGELLPYIEPAVEHLHTLGTSLHTEKILVGDGYAGKTDLILQAVDVTPWWTSRARRSCPRKGPGQSIGCSSQPMRERGTADGHSRAPATSTSQRQSRESSATTTTATGNATGRRSSIS